MAAREQGRGCGRIEIPRSMEALEKNLRAQLELHRALMVCMERKRSAIRAADLGLVQECCGQEHTLTAQLVDLDRRRLEVLRGLNGESNKPDRKSLTLSEAAAMAEPAVGTRLVELGRELREAVNGVRQLSAILCAAASALARHMAGVIQTVRSSLGPTRVYGRLGQVATGAPMQFTVDLKS